MNYKELTAGLTPLYGRSEARAIARLVFEERFGLSQTDLLLGRDADLSPKERAELEIIASKLVKGRPVQYILGYATFCGRRFSVTPDVLIPRPETEMIPGVIRRESQRSHSTILDLGTGSGCIAITLALEWPEAHVTAVDISEKALQNARDNARCLGADNIEFMRHDMLDAEDWMPFSTFDIIVSNPPYIRCCEAASMHANVLDYEPHDALFVPDNDPMLFYRAIADIATMHLNPSGLVVVEINSSLPAETAAIFQDKGFATVIINDQFGRPRFVQATHA